MKRTHFIQSGARAAGLALRAGPKERAKILQAAIDRNNEMVYVLPITALPAALVRAKSVRVERNLLSAHDVEISDYFWK